MKNKLRWCKKTKQDVVNPSVNNFMKEILEVCRKHKMCIEHEDTHGGFIIERYDADDDVEWIDAASIGTTINKRSFAPLKLQPTDKPQAVSWFTCNECKEQFEDAAMTMGVHKRGCPNVQKDVANEY